jgi:transcriptional regulator with GAF, ATPase, and Fis domain
MKPEDLKLVELLQIDEEAGTIYFKNRRMLLFDADAMGFLRRELIERLGVASVRRLFVRFGYARGFRDAMTSKEVFNWATLDDWWRAGTRLHAIEGITDSHPVLHELDPERGVFYAEGTWTTSYEAEQHLKHIGKSDTPVCWSLMGYASGYSTAVFGSEVFYFETECVGKGDAQCHVIGRALGGENVETARAAREYYQIENFEEQIPTIVSERAEIQEMMCELDRRARDLEEERARVAALDSQVFYLQEAINQNYNIEELVGVSPTFKQAMRDVERVAPTDSTVLITGETGTGKELIARAIHARSQRRQRPLITVNCAALPSGLVESELFGHERGAFTGAVQRKLGRFELANHATIFLDEVGELPLDTQAKFLRVLQQGEFERVGGTQTIKVDVRVIAATNQPLARLVEEGKYRADLYYRLNVFPINIPPLRERGDDLILLVNYFAQKFRARFRKKITSISQESLERLQQYSWPGNVRELEHIIERAVLLAEGEVLDVDLPLHDPARGLTTTTAAPAARQRLVALEEMEREYIEEVLKHTGGMIAGRGGAAEILGLPASTLRSRMKKLGIKP